MKHLKYILKYTTWIKLYLYMWSLVILLIYIGSKYWLLISSVIGIFCSQLSELSSTLKNVALLMTSSLLR